MKIHTKKQENSLNEIFQGTINWKKEKRIFKDGGFPGLGILSRTE